VIATSAARSRSGPSSLLPPFAIADTSIRALHARGSVSHIRLFRQRAGSALCSASRRSVRRGGGGAQVQVARAFLRGPGLLHLPFHAGTPDRPGLQLSPLDYDLLPFPGAGARSLSTQLLPIDPIDRPCLLRHLRYVRSISLRSAELSSDPFWCSRPSTAAAQPCRPPSPPVTSGRGAPLQLLSRPSQAATPRRRTRLRLRQRTPSRQRPPLAARAACATARH